MTRLRLGRLLLALALAPRADACACIGREGTQAEQDEQDEHSGVEAPPTRASCCGLPLAAG